jgi:hypothetical protein
MSGIVRKTVAVVAAAGVVLALGVAPGAANVRIDNIEMPAYARIAGPAVDGGVEEVFHDDEWAAIPFYRPPACVRPEFNLLLFFDIPAVFGCGPPTVSMSTIWRNGPGIDAAPIQVRVEGLGAVPVWFASWPELQAAIADGNLTIGELAALPSLLVGSASFYSETIHPTQAANVPFLQFVARGTLQDGRRFHVEATRSGGAGRLTHVGISFR